MPTQLGFGTFYGFAVGTSAIIAHPPCGMTDNMLRLDRNLSGRIEHHLFFGSTARGWQHALQFLVQADHHLLLFLLQPFNLHWSSGLHLLFQSLNLFRQSLTFLKQGVSLGFLHRPDGSFGEWGIALAAESPVIQGATLWTADARNRHPAFGTFVLAGKERIAAKGAVAGESCPAMRTYLIVGSNSATAMRTGHARGRRRLPFLLTFSRLGPEPMITPGIHGYRRSDLLLVVTRVSAYSFDWSVHSS